VRAILTYHSIDPSGSPISVDEAAFRAHVAFLASGAVRVVPLETVLSPSAPANAVALTFDDGFRNFGQLAWPLLRDRGLPATLFVVSGHAGGTNAWGGVASTAVPTLPLMGWDEIGRAREEGLALGGHSRTHPDLRRVSPGQLSDEIAGSIDDIASRTGARPASFAYPYGGVNQHVEAAAASLVSVAVTTELRTLGVREPALRLPRLDAFYLREPGQMEQWGSPAWHRRLGLRGALRRVRALVTGRPL
jgi:peptidoglycan/xylan/chitin deacetylase (PgdA/CDA1 family)